MNFDVGQKVEQTFLIDQFNLRETKGGELYGAVVFSNDGGRIDGRIWERAEYYKRQYDEGQSVRVSGTVDEYQGNKQIKVSAMNPSQKPKEKLLPSTGSRDEDIEALISLANELTSNSVNSSIDYFDRQWRRTFRDSAAASRNHHSEIGGLVSHVLSMLRAAWNLFDHYDRLDNDAVVLGVLYHDIGKTKELEQFSYTREGKLTGHISLGAKVAEESMDDCDVSQEFRQHVIHIVLSHHGRKEWGSPVEPKTKEAMFVHMLDMLDSRYDMYLDAQEGLDGYEFTQQRPIGDVMATPETDIKKPYKVKKI